MHTAHTPTATIQRLSALLAIVVAMVLLTPTAAQAANRWTEYGPGIWGLDNDDDGKIEWLYIDEDLDGHYEILAKDKNSNGKLEAIYVDRNDDGRWELKAFDGNENGRLENVYLDLNADRAYEIRLLDQNEDGIVDWKNIDLVGGSYRESWFSYTKDPGIRFYFDGDGNGLYESELYDRNRNGQPESKRFDTNGDGKADTWKPLDWQPTKWWEEMQGRYGSGNQLAEGVLAEMTSLILLQNAMP